ncbi:MAG: hypothetical protein CL933_25760 [Deltaproteobacteria bacterium]|nr:hypothetical protein [Deltaproteobacteria bacterium]
MSVHGEYSRALETLIACVRTLDRPDRESRIEQLANARVDRNPDLSTAARNSLEALRDLAETEATPTRIAEASTHLLSHCRIILGTSE